MAKEVDCGFHPEGKPMSALMSGKDVAKFWDVSKRTVLRWVQKGRLKPIRMGGTVRFKRAEVERADEGREPHDPSMG
jgi:excisionase family DNA binding protein